MLKPLSGIRVLTLAINLPGPLAACELCRLGATVVKFEPPSGDPLAHARPQWYASLHQGQTILTLNLKSQSGQEQLEHQLGHADLLLTAMRPIALQRLGLDWPALHGRHPRLCQVAVVGYPPPHDDQPGHDLTFQARAGLVQPPDLPRTCLADLAGAQQVVSTALALLLARERGQEAECAHVSLAAAAEAYAAPLHHRVTTSDGVLGGAHPGYNLYPAREGWIALAALELHFWRTLVAELGLTENTDRAQLEQAFRSRAATEWEAWAAERGLPLVAVAAS
jgi:crotonobetainyl-CoA:carnitine CoA-transferase CaiB-like acyl-CoA transferase